MHEKLQITNHSGLPSVSFDHVAGILRHHTSLQSVLDWCRAQAGARDLSDVIVQDEYTHDIVLELDVRVFAVYDAT